MRKYGVIMAICLLIVVNAVVLGGIAYNRSGEPAATITLTERELPFASYYDYRDRENTGLSLRLNWSSNGFVTPLFSFAMFRENRNPDWLDKSKLQEIGFDCSLPLNDPGAELHYQKMLPRKTYAALEFEGAAWEHWLSDELADLHKQEMQVEEGLITQKQLQDARREYELQSRTHTRLFIIDVGNDPDSLRAKHDKQGRYMILPARVRLEYHGSYASDDAKKVPPRLGGEIYEILTDTIYVPKAHRAILEKVLRERSRVQEKSYYTLYDNRVPHFEVTLHVGRRAEPWIAGVRELTAEKSK
jgi:hypothetical protein